MINIKDNPVGIDKVIQKIQQRLYDKLGYNMNSYGRIYLRKRDNKTIVTHFKGKDYKEVILNTSDIVSFFIVKDNTDIKNGDLTTDVDIVFFIDLKKVKPNIPHRADEEIRVEILNILNDTVYNANSFTKDDDAVTDFHTELINMQPYHFLRFKGSLVYTDNNC